MSKFKRRILYIHLLWIFTLNLLFVSKKNREKKYTDCGFCWILDKRFGINVYRMEMFQKHLPELFAQRPEEHYRYWFDKGDLKSRIKALYGAVKLTF